MRRNYAIMMLMGMMMLTAIVMVPLKAPDYANLASECCSYNQRLSKLPGNETSPSFTPFACFLHQKAVRCSANQLSVMSRRALRPPPQLNKNTPSQVSASKCLEPPSKQELLKAAVKKDVTILPQSQQE